MSDFCITGSKGFHVTFENGYVVSVQFGYGSYSDNHDRFGRWPDDLHAANVKLGAAGANTAETALIHPDGHLVALEEDADTVQGWRTPAQVLALMNYAAGLPKP